MCLGAMMWPLWIPCRSVWVNVGSCCVQSLSSCFSPTSPAFSCTTCVLLMMRMRIKRKMRMYQRVEKPRGHQPNHNQRIQAEKKVCVSFYRQSVYLWVCVCVLTFIFVLSRAKHTCMLWWTASMVSWRLYSVARCRSSTGRVRSGPCFAFLQCW